MLIGAHVSPAGGPAKADRARRRARVPVDPDLQPEPARLEAHALLRRGRSPRYREAIADSRVDALLIHAVYLLNCATDDPEIRDKSLASLTASLQAGDALARSASSCTPARR